MCKNSTPAVNQPRSNYGEFAVFKFPSWKQIKPHPAFRRLLRYETGFYGTRAFRRLKGHPEDTVKAFVGLLENHCPSRRVTLETCLLLSENGSAIPRASCANEERDDDKRQFPSGMRQRPYAVDNDPFRKKPGEEIRTCMGLLCDTSDDNLCSGQHLLGIVFTVCATAGLQSCSNSACMERKRALSGIVPTCQWEPFSEMLLTAISCWTPSFFAKLLLCITEHLCNSPSYSVKGAILSPCIDFHGAVDMLRWTNRILFGNDRNDDMISLQKSCIMLVGRGLPEYERRLSSIPQVCQDHDICPSRFWDLAALCPSAGWAATDISFLAKLAMVLPVTSSEVELMKHLHCTDKNCLRSNDDSTIMRQAHKCQDHACNETIDFPLHLLDLAYEEAAMNSTGENQWCPTAWSVEQPGRLCGMDDRYMAVSHVWSDGTGVGLGRPGAVNKCLFDYFAAIAIQLGCRGVWWDVVCLPTKREPRRAALNVMLENYRKAAVTIVHDQWLAGVEWRDDGSPAVALVLSPWFTRGWTAGELHSSRNHSIKVVFKDLDSGGTLLKDLDDDILTLDPPVSVPHSLPGLIDPIDWDEIVAGIRDRKAPYFESWDSIPIMGHMVASDIVRQLCPKINEDTKVFQGAWQLLEPQAGRIADLRGLLNLMGSRSTAWSKDRTLIAGLLSLRDFKFGSPSNSMQITCELLKWFGRIEVSDLLHTECTMAKSGPWSWCPPSIYDFGSFRSPSDGDFAPVANVGYQGSLRMFAAVFPVLEDDTLVPLSSHLSIVTGVSIAKLVWKTCFLVSCIGHDDKLSADSVFILAQYVATHPDADEPITLDADEPIIKSNLLQELNCRWIGCVRLKDGVGSREDQGINNHLVFGQGEFSTSDAVLHALEVEALFLDPSTKRFSHSILPREEHPSRRQKLLRTLIGQGSGRK